ncbi:carbohydrate ABC transporter permease [Lederbergia galactosidilytica]|uniref:ABC transporter permease n=1 Tax=Lederbergia galactosidilytica TaxID=217031 RepID=A0A178A611_9BACI|nr:sugar ABC transporter permease [Lederbergia galactosidilytica]KRG16330.1 ABC transporter permease [Virgibacillus soli]MBP1915096.1 raffinose/stachyose/melibiose transport system permease protein [Lederbergia galactosidilytica]OAK75541.1 ABC transporter permease [Lederbergia galactosidilytica]
MKMKHSTYWVFLAPSLLALVIVLVIPFIQGVYYSLTEYNGFQVKEFVGFDNYLNLFKDDQFLYSLLFTGGFSVASVIGINIIGLLLALFVTQKMGKFNTIFRTVFFMPNLIGGIILGFIWQFIFLKAFVGIASLTGVDFFKGWLSDTETGFWGLVILFVWQMSGYIMIIYISFLNNIPGELIEAATIDGANGWQRFWKVKFPLLAPAFTVSLFLSLSNAFKVYDQNMALTAGGPFNSTQMATMNIYDTAFKVQDMGYAQAKAIIFLLIITIISVIQLYMTRKKEIDI